MKKLVFILLLILVFHSNIFGSCGTSSCPLYIGTPLQSGIFFLNLSHEYIYQNQLYLGSAKSFVGAVPGHHDEVSTLNQRTTLSIGYGFSNKLSVSASLPFVHREHNHIHHHHGEDIWENWNFSGLGDLFLTTDY